MLPVPSGSDASHPAVLSRRRFIQAALALAAATRQVRGAEAAPEAPPPGFPSSISVAQETYQNWCGEILVPEAWTAVPESPEDVVVLANWALDHGWRVRAKGMSHGWSPLLQPGGRPLTPCLLVDFVPRLHRAWVGGGPGARTVTAQAGIALEHLWDLAGGAGLAAAAIPAPGNLTLGGALAVGAHGSALEGPGAPPREGWTYGSLSNAVLALKAVVWDPASRRYRLRTFQRGEAAIGPLLVHAGRALVVSATLLLGEEVPLRCRSFTDVPAAELFAPAGGGGRTLQAFVEEAGRVEATWFPFTECPWLRVWTQEPAQPAQSRLLEGPYPFGFANWVTRGESDAVAAWLRRHPGQTKAFLGLEMELARLGLAMGGATDLWGPSRFSCLHVKPTTFRYHVSGHAILCARKDIQRVVSELYGAFDGLMHAAMARDAYPINGPLDLRITGLDRPGELPPGGGAEPLLSPIRPRPDRPAWDCAVWVEVLTLPGTPGAAAFFTEFEGWMLENFRGDYALVRAEWAKGWAYSPRGPWTSGTFLEGHLPATYSEGYGAGGTWASAVEGLRGLDPRGLFGNPFLDRVFGCGRS